MATVKEVFKGLEVLVKYEPDAYSVNCEHDILWCGSTNPDSMTDDEKKIMDDSGWIWDDNIEGWFIFS